MLEIGKHYNVTVIKILERGAVVTISGIDGKTGFIHISNISDSYVSNIADFLSVGQTYDAVCTDLERYGFSVKHLELKSNYVPKKQKQKQKPEQEQTESKNAAPYWEKSESKKENPVSKRPVQRKSSQPPEFHTKSEKSYSFEDMISRADASLRDKQKHRTISNSSRKRKRSQKQNFEDFD